MASGITLALRRLTHEMSDRRLVKPREARDRSLRGKARIKARKAARRAS